ncbi:MAG: SPOR domain-containing protein [Bacteroidota bacterium]
MKNFLLLAFILCIKTVVAQVGPADDTTSVIVHKDPRVDALAKKQAAVNAAYKRANARSMRGYRLLIVNTNKRDEAIAAKTKIYTYFPELKAYLVYQTPYFKLKAGNFKTRDEAEKYRQNMNMIFPKGVFIVNDTIEVKPEKEKEQVE